MGRVIRLDHDDFGLNQPEIIKRDRFQRVERDFRRKSVYTLAHRALVVRTWFKTDNNDLQDANF
jgi:hypothetical protein